MPAILKQPCLLALALAFSALAATASAQTAPNPDDTRDVNLRAYAELLRSDLRTGKVAIVTEVLQLTEAEDAKFWPVYRDYENALSKLNDERIATLKDYAARYDTLTDADADRIAKAALDIQARRDTLLASYYEKAKAATSAKTAARALQVEHQILLIIDLQIAAGLPLAQ